MQLALSLVELDKELMLFLNSFHNSFFDAFMWMISSKEVWGALYLSIIFYFFKGTERKKAIYITLASILVIVLCDQISASVIKPLFQRWRPSRDNSISEFIHIVNGKRGGKYGFVSSHAANVMGLAMFGSLLFKNKLFSYLIFLWATLVALSRVYLGVHFPGDIIFGSVLGLAMGYGVYKLADRYLELKDFKQKDMLYFIVVLLITVVTILACSKYMYFAK